MSVSSVQGSVVQPALVRLPPPAPMRRGEVVARLHGGGRRNAYRRYGNLPLRYAGGKSLAVGHVLARMPDDVRRMASPFMGGGAVEIACARELGIEVRGYDVFDILTNYWRCQLRAPRQLASAILQWTPDKTRYAAIKNTLRRHWTGEARIEDELSLAAHYWFNHNLSYGPGFLGWMSGIYTDAVKFRRAVEKVQEFDCPTLQVECLSFEESLPRHRGDFLYCDPPYYLEGDSKMFRGIYPQRNFPVHPNGFDHARLAALLRRHEGGFVLSYNDCAWVHEAYAWCDIEEARWQYTLGQGETRIGKNREEGDVHVKNRMNC